MTTPKDSPTHETMNPLKPSPELVAQLDALEVTEPPEVKGRFAAEMFWRGVNATKDAIKAAEWGASQQRGVVTPERDYKALYHELLYQVGNKYEHETRHETALRYLRNAEMPTDNCEASIAAAKENSNVEQR